MRDTPFETLNGIAQIIYDKKGSNILALDVQGISTITDYLIIAEGHVDRHVAALARSIIHELEEQGGPSLLHFEGIQTGDWVVLDYGEVMVHLFGPHMRAKYSLERLFAEAKIVDLEIDVSKPAVGDSKG